MSYRAFEQTQTMESILDGNYFSSIMVDFVHMESNFVPTDGYLAHKEDFFLRRFDTTLP